MSEMEREVLRCVHCELNQFVTKSRNCRRCRKPVEAEVVEVKAVAIASAPKLPPVIGHEKKDLGFAIWFIRTGLGLSQQETAQRLGTYRTYVSKLENGRVTGCLKTVVRFAKTFDVSVAWMFCIMRGSRGLSA
ncbi:MAG: putative transcriptional regulator [Acidobacteriales bacterium]|nr:putative transcriptional regulator [Terriglobales bacterium]